MSEARQTKKDASLLVGVPLGALTALITGGVVSRFVFGGRFFDPIILVAAFVLVPIVLVVGDRRSKRQAATRPSNTLSRER
jgi:undecaprenyl pyrophosphate phosphatase UppP